MSVPTSHLAQANIALGRAALTGPIMQGFVKQLEYINSVADRSPGFIWRLQTEQGDATAVQVFDNPLIIFNMSVWASIEHLYDYVYRSDHLGPLKARRDWFGRLDRPHSVLWWIPAGSLPEVAEGESRLDLLRDNGTSPEAFTFAQLFDQHGGPVRFESGHKWEWA